MGDTQFKPGDVVQLKSGGPPMTVERSSNVGEGYGELLHCSWWAGKELKHENFAPAALQYYEKPANPYV